VKMFSNKRAHLNCEQLIGHVKIVQTVYISEVLQFIWHYIDLVEKGVNFFGPPGIFQYG